MDVFVVTITSKDGVSTQKVLPKSKGLNPVVRSPGGNAKVVATLVDALEPGQGPLSANSADAQFPVEPLELAPLSADASQPTDLADSPSQVPLSGQAWEVVDADHPVESSHEPALTLEGQALELMAQANIPIALPTATYSATATTSAATSAATSSASSAATSAATSATTASAASGMGSAAVVAETGGMVGLGFGPFVLGIGAVASLKKSGSTASASDGNLISGSVFAGPVSGGLKVTVYSASGTELAQAAVGANGSFQVNLGNYTGPVFAKVEDTNAGDTNYISEVTGTAVDIHVTLLAVSNIKAGTTSLYITPLTTIAAQKAGVLADGTGLDPAIATSLTATQVNNANLGTAKAFGLSLDITSIKPVTTMEAGANDYGRVLAAVEGMGANDQTTLNTLQTKVTVDMATGSGTLDLAGAKSLIQGSAAVQQSIQATSTDTVALNNTATLSTNISQLITPTSTQVTDIALGQLAGDDVVGNGTDGASVTFTVNKDPATLTFKLDGSTNLTPTSTANNGDGTWTVTLSTADLGTAGGHQLSATDNTLNAARMFSVADTTAPGNHTLAVAQGEDAYINASESAVNVTVSYAGIAVGDTIQLKSGGTAVGALYVVTSNDVTATKATIALSKSVLGSAGAKSITAQVRDASGNASASGNTLSLTLDETVPTLAITSDKSSLKAGETATITFTFSEDPGNTFTWDGTTGDITVTGGTLGAISGNGLTRTATFTPTANTNSATASITVASAAYADAAGNGGGAGATPSVTMDTAAPTISSFTSSTANGSYKAGDDLALSMTTNEDVTANATVTVTLETGATDRQVTLTRDATNARLFTGTYTVQAGDTTSDLAITAVSLGAGAAQPKDAAGNALTTTLPTNADSLDGSKALVIDTTAPTMASFTSSTANGSYKAGSAIALSMTTTEDMTANATVTVTLETGATDQQVTLTRDASNARLFTGTYTVQAGDTTSDLALTAVNLGAGAAQPKDAAGNALATNLPTGANSLDGSKALVIDTTAPAVTQKAGSVAPTGNLTMTINEVVSKGTSGTLSIYKADQTLAEAVDITSNLVTLDTSGGTSTVVTINPINDLLPNENYYVQFTAGALKDAAGNALAAMEDTSTWTFTAASLTTTVAAKVGGTSDSVINASDLSSLTLSGTVNDNGIGATSITITKITFTPTDASSAVEITSSTAGVTMPTVAGNNTWTLANASGWTSLLASNKTYNVRVDLSASASGSPTTGAGQLSGLQVDTTAPTMASFTSSTANGIYKTGDDIALSMTTNEDVTANSTVTVTLETGTTDRQVTLTRDASNARLFTGTYTVQAGDTTSDLAITAVSLGAGAAQPK
ncbi:MAG: hypothetical protein EBU72_10520, partial [Betaproteobacteria bacterium]|nr:hypothetical protein [Betaproteobacteria bacterium]